jgi:hypothetical protein
LWNACIKNCSYGANREVFLRDFRRVIVFSMGPYPRWLLKIWRAYADCGLLFFLLSLQILFKFFLCQFDAGPLPHPTTPVCHYAMYSLLISQLRLTWSYKMYVILTGGTSRAAFAWTYQYQSESDTGYGWRK